MVKSTDEKKSGINWLYIISVSILTFILPLICSVVQFSMMKGTIFTFELTGKWFIFSAVGLRLFLAGIKQVTNPSFTAKQIFNIDNPIIFPVLRELGFANLCFGLIGLLSLFLPSWRIVSAFGSGLYYGIAGMQHVFINSPAQTKSLHYLLTFSFSSSCCVYFIKMI